MPDNPSNPEPFGFETTIFTCWKNLASGQCQWFAELQGGGWILHGQLHENEEAARQWFDRSGGIRTLAQERWDRIPPHVKQIIEDTLHPPAKRHWWNRRP